MLSVGMIGAGIIAASHLQAISDSAHTTLCAVADLVEERAASAASPYHAAVYTDYMEMLDKEKLDAVIINLPHGLHEACVLACAARGIHMLLEKPMSVSADSCQRMIEACEKAGVVLQVGHVQRYIPQNRAARALIESGALGKLVMISDLRTNNYFRDDRPRWFLQKSMAGGGIWMNYGAHSLDKLCYLTDSSIAAITGSCTWLAAGTDVDGSAQALVRMHSGISASISICGYPVVPVDETMIYLSEGSLRLHTGKDLWIARDGHYERVDSGHYPNPFDAQWADFVEGVTRGRAVHCDGDYGRSIVDFIESVWK